MAKIDETVIQNWVIDENLFKEKVNDEEAKFHYVIEYPPGNIIDLVQPKGKDDLIMFVCGTMVSPEHIDLMKSESMSKREEFIYELRFMLNQLSCDFQLDVSNEFVLNQFILQDGIYEDGLTKNELMKTIKALFKAKMSCIWLIEKHFGMPAINGAPAPNSNDNVMFM